MADGLGDSLAGLNKQKETLTAYAALQADLLARLNVLLTVVSIQQNRIMTLQNDLDAVSAKVDVLTKAAPEIIPLTS